jgi:bifunctional non-homologous end joining protein LigD
MASFRPCFVFSAVSLKEMLPQLFHQPLRSRKAPFDHPEWIFELKYDGFRALAWIENHHCHLISRHGNRFSSFVALEKLIEAGLPANNSVLDGEIVCVDEEGRPQFDDLLFRRGNPCFFAFDLLIRKGADLRSTSLMDRKQELRRLLAKASTDLPIRYVNHIEGKGVPLFERVCALDLEGIVAKLKRGLYASTREASTWFKIKNREYSQMLGREELFERKRHREPVPGWHTCDLACEEVEYAG